MPGLLPNSGLIIEVPASEPAVGHHRRALDVNARGGVPAHVTLLFPFLPPHLIDADVLADLEELFAGVPTFDVELTDTAWFGEEVLWLAPADPKPFLLLTELIHRAFPEYPPFGGLFDDVVPHLTIGHGADLDGMRVAELAVQEHLPIRTSAGEVTLMTQDEADGAWTVAARFPLGSDVFDDVPGTADTRSTSVVP